MNDFEKGEWFWTSGEECRCRQCTMRRRQEKIKYEKERDYYAKAKEELYPKTQTKQRLKRIKSDEKWEGTHSFYQSWRPPSSLAHLMQAVGFQTPQRKGTGFVGDATGGEATQVEGGNGAAASRAGIAAGPSSRMQLEDLVEEIEEVEEESLASDDSMPSGPSGRLSTEFQEGQKVS